MCPWLFRGGKAIDLAKAVAVYDMVVGSNDFALAIMVGFLRLLRTGQTVELKVVDCKMFSPSLISIRVRFSTGAKRVIVNHSVRIRDRGKF